MCTVLHRLMKCSSYEYELSHTFICSLTNEKEMQRDVLQIGQAELDMLN